MKNLQVTRLVILFVMIVTFSNCKKGSADITPPVWNYSTFTDARDGKVYKYIKIGTQDWMTENLAYKTTNGSWYPWDSEVEGTKYGRLYTWDAAKQAVPSGWHLPTDAEWKQLEMNLGMSQSETERFDFRGTNEGRKLKATSGWSDNEKISGNGTDAVGFLALPGGFRTNSGSFYATGGFAYWWSATEIDNSKVVFRHIAFYRTEIFRSFSFKEDAYSVRCVKDAKIP